MLGAVLIVTTPKHKRNRLLVVLMLPAIALIWLVGWSLYWLGRQKDQKPHFQPAHEAKREKSNVTLIAAPSLEQEEKEQVELSA